jgi:hypothetical protein
LPIPVYFIWSMILGSKVDKQSAIRRESTPFAVDFSVKPLSMLESVRGCIPFDDFYPPTRPATKDHGGRRVGSEYEREAARRQLRRCSERKKWGIIVIHYRDPGLSVHYRDSIF